MVTLTELKATLKEKLTQYQDAAQALRDFKEKCKHKYHKVGESAICKICEHNAGWWCPDSKKHTCTYEADSEYCTKCGQPDERK